jgi:plastocyanin
MRQVHAVGCAALLVVAVVSTAIAGELKGTIKATGLKSSADAVVYIDSIPGKTFTPPKEHAKMDQAKLTFVPHVLPVLQGTTVDFVNSDAVLHNVFSPDKCCEKFNLGSWPQGKSRSYTFKNLCEATVLCHVHPEMEGYVVVLPTPWFAVTDKTGAYEIKDVPDGSYTVKVWHAKFKTQPSKSVKVAGATAVDFELKRK